jgi:hypothetical protein
MAETFDIIRSDQLPLAVTVTSADTILVIQNGTVKRLSPDLMQGAPGLSAYLQANATYIQWKQGATGTWQNLIAIASLKGNAGESPVFQWRTDGLYWKYASQADTAYTLLIAKNDLKLTFDDLTPAEIEELTLHYDDLTQAQIAELQQPATDAATDLANYMTQKDAELATLESNVNTAKDAANQAAAGANTAASDANTAKDAANQAASGANQAATLAGNAAVTASEAASEAETAASEADAAKTAAIEATNELEGAVTDAQTALAQAQEMSSHPPTIINGTWWIWNLTTHTYADTTLPARGQQGKGPVVLPGGTYGNWNETSQTYVDSGVPATAAVMMAFQMAERREQILTGENLNDFAAKAARWFNDFGPLAWKIPDIDHEPTETDLTYIVNGQMYTFEIGAEVRYVNSSDPDDVEITFYKLYGFDSDGGAIWDEAGGASLTDNIYLQGANYYNSSTETIIDGEIQ